MWVVFIILGILVIIRLKLWFNANKVTSAFKSNNVLVGGRKGKGKDALTAYVIHRRKSKKHYSNIPYNEKTELVKLEDISVSPNTYLDFIKGNVTQIEKRFDEKTDFYISDAGIYLASQYDTRLDKEFPSLPIFYALSRHLGLHNVHANAQFLGRVWKKLREQADNFILCRKCVKVIPGYLFIKVYMYERLADAEDELKPLKQPLLSLFGKQDIKVENSRRGDIWCGWVMIPKRTLKYDTRYFHEVLYGEKSPTTSAGLKKNRQMRRNLGKR